MAGQDDAGKEELLELTIESAPPLGLALSWDAAAWLRVDRTLPGAPAARSGLRPGDVLLELCGVDVTKMQREQVDALFERRPLKILLRRQGGAHLGGAETRVAVLVRTCRPTDAMVDRMLHWAEQLGTGADFFVSVDTTTKEASQTQARIEAACRRKGLEPGCVRIHCYRESELEAVYPSLNELRDRLPNGPADIPGKAGLRTMAWMFHCEPIGLWLRSLADPDVYTYVWVLEDDVGCSSALCDLLSAYAGEPHDLISGRWIAPPAPREPPQGPGFTGGWYWYYTVTEAFHKLIPAEQRLITEEHVQRISMRLLKEVERWARAGISTVSEQLVPTVAHVSGMLMMPLRAEHIGEPFHYDAKIEELEWKAILQAHHGDLRLYHALKF